MLNWFKSRSELVNDNKRLVENVKSTTVQLAKALEFSNIILRQENDYLRRYEPVPPENLQKSREERAVIADLKEEIKKLRKLVDIRQASVDCVSAANKKLREDNEKLKETIAKWYSAADEKYSGLRDENDKLKLDISAARLTIEELEGMIEGLKDGTNIDSQMGFLESKTRLVKELAESLRENQKLKEENNKLQDLLAVKDHNDSVDRELGINRDNISVRSFEKPIPKIGQVIADLKKENNRLVSCINTLESRNAVLVGEQKDCDSKLKKIYGILVPS